MHFRFNFYRIQGQEEISHYKIFLWNCMQIKISFIKKYIIKNIYVIKNMINNYFLRFFLFLFLFIIKL